MMKTGKNRMNDTFKHLKKFWKRSSFLTAGAGAVLLIAACSVEPKPNSDWERAVRVDRDVREMFGDQRVDIIVKPLTMYDAMARALKFNLNARLKKMETLLAAQNLNVTSTDMWPELSAKAGYAGRNNYEAVVSKSTRTGVLSEPKIYSEKTHAYSGIQLSWNILDFGISYYRSRQAANKVLMAQERYRKQLQTLLQEVRDAFWRAIAAERLTPDIDDLMEEATFVLESLQADLNENKSANSQVLLNYKMNLLETMRDLSEMKKELLMAHDRLAGLMNVKPGTRFRLVGPEEGNFVLPEIRTNLDRLEWLALMNRPELREEDYKLRNTRLQAREGLLRLLPGVDLFAGANYDSDSRLVNNSWLRAAAEVGMNLLNPLKMQSKVSAAEVKEATDNLNRQAIAMAVMTQTHLGWERYQGAKETYQLSVEITNVATEIAQRTSDAGGDEKDSAARAEKVATAARALFARLRSAMNFADLQDATGYVLLTLGMDAVPAELVSQDVDTLSKALERVMLAWDMGRFTNEDMPKLPPVPMHKPPVFIDAQIPLKKVVEDMRFVVTIPPVAFEPAELGREDIAYTATMIDGSPLPFWMFFDSKTITLSGKPPAGSEGFYEIKISARNPKKASAFVILTIQVTRGYQTLMDLRGAERNSRVMVIQKCTETDVCQPDVNLRQIDMYPDRVTVSPLPFRQAPKQ